MTDRLQIKTVEFSTEGGKASGYEARPTAAGAYPGVIVIQEYWGVNEHIKDITRRIANEGYVALAPDVYHGKIAKDSSEASQTMMALDKEEALVDLLGAVRYLQHGGSARVGVMGFCMGGSYTLMLACRSNAVKGAVAFYGHPPDPIDQVKNIQCPVLFIAGGKDQWINADKVQQLRTSFERNGVVNAEIKVYPDAGHAFFNDTRPEAYNAAAAQDAWTRTLSLFSKNLKS